MKFDLLQAILKKKNKVGAQDAEVNEEEEDNAGRKLTDNSVKSYNYKKSDDRGENKDIEKGEDYQTFKDSSSKGNFPCCFYIPLDIAMEGFAFIDIAYYSCFALVWAIFLALEPFAGKDEKIILQSLNNSTNPDPAQGRFLMLGKAALNVLLQRTHARARNQFTADPDERYDYPSFSETTTTFAPLEHHAVDKMNEARVYSRIAQQFKEFGQEIDDGCGRDYYSAFLYANQLDITRGLFEQVARKVIFASLLYTVIGCVLLTTICCFRGYIASKVLIIFLWYIQLIPSYLILRAAVMSQSHRFCILQYGIGKTIRGQGIIFWSLLWPLLSYKPYEVFIWANYIRRYFKNKEGKLLDESYFSTAKLEERQHKQFALNPFIPRDEHQHHRRQLDRTKLFRHTQKRDGGFETQDKSFQIPVAPRRSDSN